MKHTAPFVLFLLILSCISGYLLSKASLVGRVGINLFYKEYKFLKVWWQGALAVFAGLIILFFIHWTVNKKLAKAKANLIHILLFVAAVAGLYFTYYDFRHTNTHRWLGERFHLGGYLFWFGWMAICIFFLVQKKAVPFSEATPTNNAITTDNKLQAYH